jgi:oxygen-independent coproporphyrinogen-3 oxidase
MDNSIKQKVLAANKAVPRYTSYPTAPHFVEGFSEATYKKWLHSLKVSQTLSLYIHVPFCPKLCWFCGCNTKITQREAPVIEYVDTLKAEIVLIAAHIPKGMKLTQLHFGGGSPTILSPVVFDDLMATLRKNFTFTHDAEVAIEIDPRNFTEALAATYAKCGVNRVSFGVQDFDEKVMNAVNRPQLFKNVYNAMTLARSYGINAINVDLMYGLPHQTRETMQKLAENVALLQPDRIALFGYAHVPWMKKHMRLIPEDTLPDNDMRYDLFEITAQKIEEAGYKAVGIDHFAKAGDALVKAQADGKLRRNFQGYTPDNADVLLGLGASAISRFPQGYAQNTIHGPQYRDRVMGGIIPIEKSCVLNEDDSLHADIIERLICDMHVDLAAISKKHHMHLSDLSQSLDKLMPLVKTGLVNVKPDGTVRVETRLMARLACSAFDKYLRPLPDNVQRHVSAI